VRLGEALGLRWEHVDFEGGFLHVRNQLTCGRLAELKTGAGRCDAGRRADVCDGPASTAGGQSSTTWWQLYAAAALSLACASIRSRLKPTAIRTPLPFSASTQSFECGGTTRRGCLPRVRHLPPGRADISVDIRFFMSARRTPKKESPVFAGLWAAGRTCDPCVCRCLQLS
jgi:hypothetical protein